MAAYVQDAAVLVNAGHTLFHLALEDVELAVAVRRGLRQRRSRVSALQSGIKHRPDLPEYPGAAEGGAPHHDGIHSVILESPQRAFGRGDVAVPYDGNTHAGIPLHLPDKAPVGLAGVHLRPRAAVYRERLYAAVLQLLGQRDDDPVFRVPSQTGLGGDGHTDGIDHGTGDGEHARNVLQETRTGSLAGHTLHGTAEIDVQHVGTRLLHHNLRRIAHRHGILAVDLYRDGTFLVADTEFVQTLAHHADQRVGGHKLGIDHRGAHPAAKQTETDVRNVFHRGQQNGSRPQIYCSYLHSLTSFFISSPDTRRKIRIR